MFRLSLFATTAAAVDVFAKLDYAVFLEGATCATGFAQYQIGVCFNHPNADAGAKYAKIEGCPTTYDAATDLGATIQMYKDAACTLKATTDVVYKPLTTCTATDKFNGVGMKSKILCSTSAASLNLGYLTSFAQGVDAAKCKAVLANDGTGAQPPKTFMWMKPTDKYVALPKSNCHVTGTATSMKAICKGTKGSRTLEIAKYTDATCTGGEVKKDLAANCDATTHTTNNMQIMANSPATIACACDGTSCPHVSSSAVPKYSAWMAVFAAVFWQVAL